MVGSHRQAIDVQFHGAPVEAHSYMVPGVAPEFAGIDGKNAAHRRLIANVRLVGCDREPRMRSHGFLVDAYIERGSPRRCIILLAEEQAGIFARKNKKSNGKGGAVEYSSIS